MRCEIGGPVGPCQSFRDGHAGGGRSLERTELVVSAPCETVLLQGLTNVVVLRLIALVGTHHHRWIRKRREVVRLTLQRGDQIRESVHIEVCAVTLPA